MNPQSSQLPIQVSTLDGVQPAMSPPHGHLIGKGDSIILPVQGVQGDRKYGIHQAGEVLGRLPHSCKRSISAVPGAKPAALLPYKAWAWIIACTSSMRNDWRLATFLVGTAVMGPWALGQTPPPSLFGQWRYGSTLGGLANISHAKEFVWNRVLLFWALKGIVDWFLADYWIDVKGSVSGVEWLCAG